MRMWLSLYVISFNRVISEKKIALKNMATRLFEKHWKLLEGGKWKKRLLASCAVRREIAGEQTFLVV
jgi:hypothetical protein